MYYSHFGFHEFVIALGSGDKAAADEIARQRQAAHQAAEEPHQPVRKVAPVAHDPESRHLLSGLLRRAGSSAS